MRRLALALVLWAPVCSANGAELPGVADLGPGEKAAFLAALREANGAFDAGRFDDALARYDALIARVSLAELHFRRGACLERLGRPGDAAAAYHRYLALAPDAREAGRVRFDIDRLEAAAREAARPRPVVTETPPPAPASQAPSAPPPAPEPGRHRTLAWVLTGSAGALGVGAGVLAWLTSAAITDANDYDRRAPGHDRAGLAALEDDARGLETAFWITGGVALAAGLGAGAVFLFGETGDSGSQTSTVAVAPGGFVLKF